MEISLLSLSLAKKKIHAHAILSSARKQNGEQVLPCRRCGAIAKVIGHHHNYDKPYEVIWLCRPCHGQVHAGHAEISNVSRQSRYAKKLFAARLCLTCRQHVSEPLAAQCDECKQKARVRRSIKTGRPLKKDRMDGSFAYQQLMLLCKERSIKLYDIAKRGDLPRTYYIRLRNGLTVSPVTVEKIAAVLSLDVADLMARLKLRLCEGRIGPA